MAVSRFLTNSTTLVLNGELIKDFINGDVIELAFVNPLTSRVYGANRAVNITQRSDNDVATLTVRVQRYSDNDIWLNEQVNNETPVIFEGSLKEVYIKDGSESVESYEIISGSITTKPTYTKNNQDGNATVEYVMECFARRLV